MRESWLARTPLRGHKAAALPLMPLAWRTLSRSSHYDIVVSSSHCMSHAVRFYGSKGTRYLSYVHTPMRYIWLPELDPRAGASFIRRSVMTPLRSVDRLLTKGVSSFAANSEEVRRRIELFWQRPSRVIYPPVDTTFFHFTPPSTRLPFSEYLIAVSRWTPYKKVDLAIRIAQESRMPLVIVGSGPDEPRLRAIARNSCRPVVFERQPARNRIRELYSGASALLFPVHEDFGIVPVEALACGTPVVGLGRGGLLETVQHGKTGWLAPTADLASMVEGVKRVRTFTGPHLRESVLRFSRTRFRREFSAWIDDEADLCR